MKGKHGANENARLRADLAEAESDNRRLRAQIARMETQIAKAEEWIAGAKVAGMPGLAAERARADAAHALAATAKATERARWEAMRERLQPYLKIIGASNLRFVPDPDSEDFIVMHEMFGNALMLPADLTRTQKRNTATTKTLRQTNRARAAMGWE